MLMGSKCHIMPIPRLIENENTTMRNKLNSFPNLESRPSLFSVLLLLHFTNSGFIVLIWILFSIYFDLFSLLRLIRLVQNYHFISLKPK